ncbi:MAG: hypothetical protein R6U91_09325 [Bacillota bacterium]
MITFKRILRKQEWHLVLLALLLALTNAGLNFYPNFFFGEFRGISTTSWLWIGVLTAILHQGYMVIVLRTELETRWLSTNAPRLGYLAYMSDYTILVVLRVATIFASGIANREVLAISDPNRLLFIVVLAVPCLWVLYLLARDGNFKQLAGEDYFKPEQDSEDYDYARENIFRSTAITVYSLGPMALYIPGIVFASPAALLLALFNHLYIWVHHFCTELPDREHFYKPPS